MATAPGSSKEDANTKRVNAIRRALGTALTGWEQKLLERDAAELGGDKRRARAFSAEIKEILGRLDREDVRSALSRPLAQAYEDSDDAGVTSSIDRDRLRALSDVLIDPLQRSLPSAKSPLAYVAPKLLAEEDRQKLIELSIRGTAQGMTTAQLARVLAQELPASRRLLKGEFEKGPTLLTDGGARVQAGRYAEMLARTTTYYASNQGVVDRAEEAGIPCVKFTVAPGCHDFCLDLNNCIFALTDEAAETYDVPLLAEIPGGSVPSHPNCRCTLSPFTPRKSDAGKLTVAPKDTLANGKGRRDSTREAESAFKARLEKDPLKYSSELAESAARRGFGGSGVGMNGASKQLIGMEIPGLPPGQREAFGPKRALSEDVHLAKRIQDGDVSSRKEYRQRIADTLRAGADDTQTNFVSREKRLHYFDAESKWIAIVDPKTGLAVTGFPLRGQSWAEYRGIKEQQ